MTSAIDLQETADADSCTQGHHIVADRTVCLARKAKATASGMMDAVPYTVTPTVRVPGGSHIASQVCWVQCTSTINTITCHEPYASRMNKTTALALRLAADFQ